MSAFVSGVGAAAAAAFTAKSACGRSAAVEVWSRRAGLSWIGDRVAASSGRASARRGAACSSAAAVRVKMSAAQGECALGALPVFAQTMLRVSDPEASRNFYEKQLGMRFLTQLDFEDLEFSLLFFAYTNDTPVDPSLSQTERAQWLWTRPYPTVELTHNWGSNDAYHNGNTPPTGYVGLGVLAHDAAAAFRRLKAEGVAVEREPGASQDAPACVRDPDGYLVELHQNSATESPAMSTSSGTAAAAAAESNGLVGRDAVYASTTMRVMDAKKSIEFYERLGMKYLGAVENQAAGFTAHYLGYTDAPSFRELNADAPQEELASWLSSRRFWTLVLREEVSKPEGGYHNGNTDPRGYGHIGITIEKLYDSVGKLKDAGVGIKREPGPFKDAGEIAFALDPDGYFIELIQRRDVALSSPYVHPPS
mmetsp:Transcript_7615/g.20218  ORF Transcript_7615/g.20218 Transcript_7615/m.20218 type:complete len:422 (+) Transcript_7615:1526-2791(+)